MGRRPIGPWHNMCEPPLARCRRGPARPAECARSRSPSALLRSRPSRAHAHTTTGCCAAAPPRPSNPRRVCAGHEEALPRRRRAPARPECAHRRPSSACPRGRPPRARARAPTSSAGRLGAAHPHAHEKFAQVPDRYQFPFSSLRPQSGPGPIRLSEFLCETNKQNKKKPC